MFLFAALSPLRLSAQCLAILQLDGRVRVGQPQRPHTDVPTAAPRWMLFRSRRSSASVSPTLPTASRRLSCGSFCRTSRLAAAAQAIGELRCLFVCFFALFVCALTRWSAVRVYKVPRCHIRAGTGPAPATSAPGLRCACSTFNVLVGAAGASAPVAECTSFERKSTKGLQARTARASAAPPPTCRASLQQCDPSGLLQRGVQHAA